LNANCLTFDKSFNLIFPGSYKECKKFMDEDKSVESSDEDGDLKKLHNNFVFNI